MGNKKPIEELRQEVKELEEHNKFADERIKEIKEGK